MGGVDNQLPFEVATCQGVRRVHNGVQVASSHNLPALDSGAGPQVHDIVGRTDGLFIMLHHHHGVAHVTQVLQGFQQAVVIPLVQADGGFIQHIQHPHQAAADLAGQPDALTFPARQGGCWPAEGQVMQAHIQQELQPALDLLEHLLRNDQRLRIQFLMDGPCPAAGFTDVEVHDIINIATADGHSQAFRPQALAAAGRAGLLAHEALVPAACTLRTGLAVAPLEAVDDPFGGVLKFSRAAVGFPGLLDMHPAVEDGLAAFFRDLRPGRVQIRAEFSQDLPGCAVDARFLLFVDLAPGTHRAFANRLAGINDAFQVKGIDLTQAVAVRAHAQRRVKAEHGGFHIRKADAAVRAG